MSPRSLNSITQWQILLYFDVLKKKTLQKSKPTRRGIRFKKSELLKKAAHQKKSLTKTATKPIVLFVWLHHLMSERDQETILFSQFTRNVRDIKYLISIIYFDPFSPTFKKMFEASKPLLQCILIHFFLLYMRDVWGIKAIPLTTRRTSNSVKSWTFKLNFCKFSVESFLGQHMQRLLLYS